MRFLIHDIQQEERIEAIYQPGLVYHGGTKGDDKFWLRNSSDGVALIGGDTSESRFKVLKNIFFSLHTRWLLGTHSMATAVP